MQAILTSYNRFDLLRETLTSLLAFYPDLELYVYDDYGYDRMPLKNRQELAYLMRDFPTVKFEAGRHRIGQIAALDHLMQHITDEYYFTCEDDWRFVGGGFIEDSLYALDESPNMIQCQLRGYDDLNGHPISDDTHCISQVDFTKMLWFKVMSTNYTWRGFSFNPSVRRLSDYRKIGSYGAVATFDPTKPWQAEKDIGEWYYQQGYHAVVLENRYVEHIGGEGRGIRK
jgi:GT2 family glycosyltransferase